jgi:hypothetical protein
MKYFVTKQVTYDLEQEVEAESEQEAIEVAEIVGDWEQLDGSETLYKASSS